MSLDWSIIINIVLGLGIIIQGISKIISDAKIKEAKDEIIKTKEAQISYYKELLTAEKGEERRCCNRDVQEAGGELKNNIN